MVSAREVGEDEEALVTSIFLIRLWSDIILSSCFACSEKIAIVTADVIALAINYSTEGFMKWLGM